MQEIIEKLFNVKFDEQPNKPNYNFRLKGINGNEGMFTVSGLDTDFIPFDCILMAFGCEQDKPWQFRFVVKYGEYIISYRLCEADKQSDYQAYAFGRITKDKDVGKHYLEDALGLIEYCTKKLIDG